MHNGHRKRLKERFLKEDIDNFESHNILELLLFWGVPQKDTNELAHKLLQKYGTVSQVFDAPFNDLMSIEGVGENVATLIKLIPSLSRVYLNDKVADKKFFHTTKEIGSFLAPKFYGKTKEQVFAVFLDGKFSLLGEMNFPPGSLNGASIDVRKIIECVLKFNAYYVILAHNHPGGIALPSREDMKTTNTIRVALETVSARLLDHLVFADDDFVSFKDSNLI